MGRIRPEKPPGSSELIGHIFRDQDGKLSITPCLRTDEVDKARLRICARRIGRWVSATERLLRAAR